MPGLLESCKKLFKTKDLYKVLSLPKNASPSEGEVDDEDDVLTQDKDWYDYWRILFHQVTPQDIKEFEEKYKGSDEELSDLKIYTVNMKADEEADEADEEAKKLGLGEEDEALKSLIHSNQQSRAKQMDSFFADLEAKYAEPEKKTKKLLIP
ncbi:DNAJC9 [Mytilus edulis]|uniref:DNAJC9 n=1 Tax=Mytilus edulis TaxID=6550 RepID=A0A8S3VD45_MYTED|nr:DNAJC9 [Mytilus edulis]